MYKIFYEDGKWLGNQKSCAKFLGISTKHFQSQDFEPVYRKGREAFYDVHNLSDDPRESGELDPNAELARLRKEQADKTEIEVAKLRGDLIERDQAADDVGRAFSIVRTRMLAIPSSISPYLEGLDRTEIETQLNDAIYDGLASLADGDLGASEAPAENTD